MKNWYLLGVMLGLTIPSLAFQVFQRTGVLDLSLHPFLSAPLFGIAIVGSAFLLAWATEVSELDIPQGLAIAFVALIAVLPEYAVDFYLTWEAGQNPDGPYVHYAAANMTGSNRLLVGLGWPMVALLFWIRERRTLKVGKALSLELLFLSAATVYSFTIPFKSSIALFDSVVLVALFAVYIWLSSKGKHEEPTLVGPSKAIGNLPTTSRRLLTAFLFIWAAFIIIVSAKPFAEGLLSLGVTVGLDEFLLVQWIAPLASESPELLIASVFTVRGMSGAAITTLVSAKVNQWTLLVGTLPIVYSLSLGETAHLPLDLRQNQEFLLTSAQSLFAVVLIVHMYLSWRGATILLFLFGVQLLSPLYPNWGLGPLDIQDRLLYVIVYFIATITLLTSDRTRIRQLVALGPAVYKARIRREEV